MIRARPNPLSVAVTVVLALAVLATTFAETTAAHADEDVTGCLADEELDDPGTAMPVLLVHGWRGTTDHWDALKDRIESLSVPMAVTRFDYEQSHRQWVTHDQIAPRLRRHVLCLADVSQANGGLGRVAIVGHSMGGLATREALADGPDGRGTLHDEVAFVATFGTPHAGPQTGTDRVRRFATSLLRLGDATVYDRERLEWIASSNPDAGLGRDPAGRALRSVVTLDALPTFPDQVPVLSVAGNYVERPRLGFYDPGPGIVLGDAVVSARSATEHARELDGLGGEEVHECRLPGPLSAIAGSYEVWLTRHVTGGAFGCWHGRITQVDRVTQTTLTNLVVASGRDPRQDAEPQDEGPQDEGPQDEEPQDEDTNEHVRVDEASVEFVRAVMEGAESSVHADDAEVFAQAQRDLADDPSVYDGPYEVSLYDDYVQPEQYEPGCWIPGDITVLCYVEVQRTALDGPDTATIVEVAVMASRGPDGDVVPLEEHVPVAPYVLGADIASR